ncbi:hypothetical protein Poly51_17510 [Rubripirellula tenax]|uniref:Uncharacterized protein n=1 Tax=Rubripirellula tenax TaxID=2528015 RepID=A0A5C6FEE5_9BACT|nr:hypothetical protein [Rubripirellula tenax]TWU58970.1 hypothetical protein Poly51_17510 [Rubripirellula tenax]
MVKQSSAGLVLGSLSNIGSVIALVLILPGTITFTRADWVMSTFVAIPLLLMFWSIVSTMDCLRFGGVRRWGRMLLAWIFTWAWGRGLNRNEPLGFDPETFSQPALYQFSTDYGVSVVGCLCVYLVVIEAIAIVMLPGDHKRPFMDQFFDGSVGAYPNAEEWESEWESE